MKYRNLNPQKALIWRIIHRDNLQWILDHGLHCAGSLLLAPDFVNIGNPELIERRSRRVVPIEPGGTLSDYVPFYFTPFSPMLYNIHTGRGGVPRRSNEEIVILVSSLYHLKDLGIPFIFTNAHAYPEWTDYYNDLRDLSRVDWALLQARDFTRDQNDLRKFERYQAEALVYKHLPVQGLIGVICYTERLQLELEQQVKARGLSLQIHARPGWYFE